MDYQELEQLRERHITNQVCQRAHLFSLAYRDIQASLKSKNFIRWGICQDFSWPSHWYGIKALGTESLIFSREDGKMVIRINDSQENV